MIITEQILNAIASTDERGITRAELIATTGLTARSVEFGLTTLRQQERVPHHINGRHSRYFAKAEWAQTYNAPEACALRFIQAQKSKAAYRAERYRLIAESRAAERAAMPPKAEPAAKTARPLKVAAEAPTKVSGEAIVPAHVVVQRLPGFAGDVRYAPDLHQAFGCGSFSDEWRRMRAGAGE